LKRICQAGAGIEPGNVIASLPTDGAEVAAHQNLSVRLHNQGIHPRQIIRVEFASNESAKPVESKRAIR